MRRSRSVKKEVVTGKKLGGSDIYISELDGIVDLLASNNRPKWGNGEEGGWRRGRERWRRTRCSEIILGFINILDLEK